MITFTSDKHEQIPPLLLLPDRNQVKKIAEQNATVSSISGFLASLRNMLQLLFLLLKFQLG